jgi:hypothetical protein
LRVARALTEGIDLEVMMRSFALAAVALIGCAPDGASRATTASINSQGSTVDAQIGELADGTLDGAMALTANQWLVNGVCELGKPFDNGQGVYAYPFMTGFAQDVQGGWPGPALLANDRGDEIARVVAEPVRSVYLATVSGTPQASWLGLPIEDAHTGLTGQPTQAFANGLIHWDPTSSSMIAVATPTYVIAASGGRVALGGANATAIATPYGANGAISFTAEWLNEPWVFASPNDFVRITITETLGANWSLSWYNASGQSGGIVSLLALGSQTIVVPVPGSILLQSYGVNGAVQTRLFYEILRSS